MAPARDKRAAWRVISASVPGADHVRNDEESQDAAAWRVRSDLLIAAVADGAGSARLGGTGARIAVRAAVESLRSARMADLRRRVDRCLRAAHAAALEAIRQEAHRLEAEPKELATTLSAIVAAPGQVASLQIGDGAVVVACRNGDLELMSAPQSGEFINETSFLTGDASIDSAALRVFECGAAHVAAMTDGLLRLAIRLSDGAPHAPFFAPLFRYVSHPGTDPDGDRLAEFLRADRVRERTGDDLTLLLAALTE
jgi:hypothetical protein